jgi:molecular chaperone DnaK
VRDSDTIDFGIYLGAGHSAIAVVEDGDAVLVRNSDGCDFTPTAVWLARAGDVRVGRMARQRVSSDPENTAAEFRSDMGRPGARRSFARAGLELTPTQLSAEVLASLRSDAAHHRGAPPEFAVITVPARCTPDQSRATTEAAALAGFNPACPLVPEPVAAALA